MCSKVNSLTGRKPGQISENNTDMIYSTSLGEELRSSGLDQLQLWGEFLFGKPVNVALK